MTQRRIDQKIWTDKWFFALSVKAKLLFFYLITGVECNSAGVYNFLNESASLYTGISEDEIPSLFKELEPQVECDPNEGIVWVKHFLRYQTYAKTYLVRVARDLENLGNSKFPRKCVEYNAPEIEIPYRFPNSKKDGKDAEEKTQWPLG